MKAFDHLIQALNPPMAVVTVAAAQDRAGCLVGFHSQSSIQPRRYCVWLSKANRTSRVSEDATHAAVHFLTEHDHGLAELFGGITGDRADKFELCRFDVGVDGVPILSECSHWLVGRRESIADDGGDHVCMTLEVVQASAGGDFRPLRLRDVEDISAGHPADEGSDIDN